MRPFRLFFTAFVIAGAVWLTGVEAKSPDSKASSKAELRKAKKQEAMNEMLAKAEAGDAEAQMVVGHCYLKGKNVPKDTPKGLGYLESASEKGNKDAQAALIEIYGKGKYGVAKDPAKVEALYVKLGITSPEKTKAAYDTMKGQLDTLLQSNDERAAFINRASKLDKNSPLSELASGVIEGTRLMEKAHAQRIQERQGTASETVNP